MNKRRNIPAILISLLTLISCTQEVQMVSLGIDDYYYIYRMQKLGLNPEYTGKEYRWSIETEAGKDSILSTDKKYIFLTEKEGTYNLTFEIIDSITPYKHRFKVTVLHEEVEYSPYISHVYEYRPAPGQFVNTMPSYENGDTEEDMRIKAEDCISGVNNIMISLGAFGGYVTFGFDHTVMNIKGEKDFLILGNAFYSDIPIYDQEKGGSSEPGIVMVAYDKNMNGKPDDDEWYELAGSEYYKPTTIKGYEITYHRSNPDKVAKPDESGYLTDIEYIPWHDNQGDKGYVYKNKFYDQNYYPSWIKEDEYTFQGTLLPQNAVDESGFGSYWVLYAYPWGYADNHPNKDKDLNSFDIGWAVDKNGNPVHLPGIDFVRVYTGINQYCGWLGETSTEISQAQDLHIPVKGNGIPDPMPTTRKSNITMQNISFK